VLLYGRFQSLPMLGCQSAQQGQELSVQLANRAFVDQQTALLQVALDFDELPMLVLVPPADESQHIKAIGAVGQTDGEDAAGIGRSHQDVCTTEGAMQDDTPLTAGGCPGLGICGQHGPGDRASASARCRACPHTARPDDGVATRMLGRPSRSVR